MKIRIYVTKDDIIDAERGNCKKCPVALAVNRHIGLKITTVCGDGIITIRKREFEVPKVQNFVRKFDNGLIHKAALKPFNFNLEF